MTIWGEFVNGLSEGYSNLNGIFGEEYALLFNVFIFAILIAIYAIFTWNFYRHLSKKDLISLNLAKYNTSKHPFINKTFALVFYVIEYILLLPLFVFIWFVVLSVILLLMAPELDVASVLVISAAVVAAVRVLSYYQEDLSKDLAKLFPFTVLAVSLLTPGFFSIPRVLAAFGDASKLFGSILYFLILVVFIELVLRILEGIQAVISSKD